MSRRGVDLHLPELDLMAVIRHPKFVLYSNEIELAEGERLQNIENRLGNKKHKRDIKKM